MADERLAASASAGGQSHRPVGRGAILRHTRAGERRSQALTPPAADRRWMGWFVVMGRKILCSRAVDPVSVAPALGQDPVAQAASPGGGPRGACAGKGLRAEPGSNRTARSLPMRLASSWGIGSHRTAAGPRFKDRRPRHRFRWPAAARATRAEPQPLSLHKDGRTDTPATDRSQAKPTG
jgi:hypothetical protein